LNGDEVDRLRQSTQYGGVIVTLGAEYHGRTGRGRPVLELLQFNSERGTLIDPNAVLLPPMNLGAIGIDEKDSCPSSAQGIADGTANATGADDMDRFFGSHPCLYYWARPTVNGRQPTGGKWSVNNIAAIHRHDQRGCQPTV